MIILNLEPFHILFPLQHLSSTYSLFSLRCTVQLQWYPKALRSVPQRILSYDALAICLLISFLNWSMRP